MVKIAHYVNQFFGQIGGEDEAGVSPRAVERPVGPGIGLQHAVGDAGVVEITLICGDNYFNERTDDAVEELLALLQKANVDLLIAGPAFLAGRYGVACSRLCVEAQDALGLPVVTALSPNNPATEVYRKRIKIVATGDTASSMRAALPRIADIGLRLARGEVLGAPEDEGYVPQGFRRNMVAELPGAERALKLLRDKLAGKEFITEIPLQLEQGKIPAAPPVADLATAKLALITTGGLVPKGNPDRLSSYVSDRFARYPLGPSKQLEPGQYEGNHGGYFKEHVNANPHRLLPVDALHSMIDDGLLGDLYPQYYTFAGAGTDPQVAGSWAVEIVPELKESGVEAVLLTST